MTKKKIQQFFDFREKLYSRIGLLKKKMAARLKFEKRRGRSDALWFSCIGILGPGPEALMHIEFGG